MGINPKQKSVEADDLRPGFEVQNLEVRAFRTSAEEKGREVMASKVNPERVKTNADTVLGVWKSNGDFKLKDVTLESFENDAKRLNTILNEIQNKEQELTPLRNERDDLSLKLNEVCTRARGGMRSFFGPNSSQYEQVGGTRAVERKKPQRKAATAAQARA